MRELSDIVSLQSLTEEQLNTLQSLIAEDKEEELVEYCHLNELDLSKIKKWAATGALAAALGLTAAAGSSTDAEAGWRNHDSGPAYGSHFGGRGVMTRDTGPASSSTGYIAPPAHYKPTYDYNYRGQEIVFISHPSQSELVQARRLGQMTTMRVPHWPNPVSAFMYSMNGVVYVVPLPGQLP